MNNTFDTYKKSTYENTSGNMILTIDDVYSDVMYISISTQAKTPDKISMSLKLSSSNTDSVVELVPSICTMTECFLKAVYDIFDKSFSITGIPGLFILKNVPDRPNEKSPIQVASSSPTMEAYTPFPSSSPTFSSQVSESFIRSVVPFSNFITVTFTISNSSDWKLDLIDSDTQRIVKTFKNTIPLDGNTKEDNRITFQNVQKGNYIIKLIPYSVNNVVGKESISNQVSIGSDNMTNTARNFSPISVYTPFPSSAASSPSLVTPFSSTATSSPNVPYRSSIQPSPMPMSMTPL